MALTVGVDTWLTVADADAIHDKNMAATLWFELPAVAGKGERSKETVLATAFKEIIASTAVTVSANSTDKVVQQAQAEMALFLLENYDDLKARRAAIASGLSEFTYSKRKETFSSIGLVGLPLNIIGLLSAYSNASTTVELKV